MKQFRIYSKEDAETLGVDEGDIAIVENTFLIIDKSEEVRNGITQNLKTFLGEYFMDKLLGVPYYQLIFDKVTPLDLIDSVMKDTVLTTNGVVEILTWENPIYSSNQRSLSFNFTVGTLDEDITISETVNT